MSIDTSEMNYDQRHTIEALLRDELRIVPVLDCDIDNDYSYDLVRRKNEIQNHR